MTESLNPVPKPSEADLAWEFLQAHGRPMYYKELVGHVLKSQGLPQEPAQIAAVLTQINLDSRFAYIGQGEWGLKAWMPARGARRLPTITLLNRSVAYDDELDKVLDKDGEDFEHAESELEDDALDSEEVLDDGVEGDVDEDGWDE